MDAEARRALEELAEHLRAQQLDVDWLKDQQHMLTTGVQTVVSAQLTADTELSALRESVAIVRGTQRLHSVMLGVPCFLATVVLLRVVWMLLPRSMEPLALAIASVLP